jgi:1,4-dihydroxy-2-naphthoate octaprenyltransferase
MTKNQAWLKALRFRTLPLSLSGIILGSFIAKFYGFWDWALFSLAMTTTILFQIISNLANDLGDSLKGTDNEERVGPMRSVQSGVISKTEMRNAVIFTSFLSLLSASLLIFIGTKNLPNVMIWFYIGLAFACTIAAITYTVGKNAYGYNGLGDIMVFLFFGFVSVAGVYPLYAKSFDWILLLPSSCIGFLSAGVLNLNNMRDRINDSKSKKKTLVVLMGDRLAKIYHVILIISGIICQTLFITNTGHYFAYIGLIPGIILLIHIQKVIKTTDPKEFDPELKKVAMSTFGIAVLTSIGLFIGS